MLEKKLGVKQVRITNTSGSAYSQGDFVLEQGYFGDVVDPDGIANGAEGIISIDDERIVETSQTKAGDTFAVSTDETPSVVYFDRTNAYLTDTNSATVEPVGTITYGGAADSNDVIRFKPYPQSAPAGVLPAGSVSSAELAADTIQYATVSISSAQLLAANTTPIELVAAPGASKAIEFISAALFLDYGTAAYATNGDVSIVSGTTGTAYSDTVAAADWLFSTADDYRLVQALSADIQLDVNESIELAVATGDPVTGDSTAVVKVAYRVHDFS